MHIFFVQVYCIILLGEKNSEKKNLKKREFIALLVEKCIRFLMVKLFKEKKIIAVIE